MLSQGDNMSNQSKDFRQILPCSKDIEIEREKKQATKPRSIDGLSLSPFFQLLPEALHLLVRCYHRSS